MFGGLWALPAISPEQRKTCPGVSVRSITGPLLLVHGDEDFPVSRQQAFDLAEQVEDTRLLNLPFASHTVLEDKPEEVVPANQAFIARLPRRCSIRFANPAIAGPGFLRQSV